MLVGPARLVGICTFYSTEPNEVIVLVHGNRVTCIYITLTLTFQYAFQKIPILKTYLSYVHILSYDVLIGEFICFTMIIFTTKTIR